MNKEEKIHIAAKKLSRAFSISFSEAKFSMRNLEIPLPGQNIILLPPKKKMEREEGFYWVKLYEDEPWQIAHWTYSDFYLTGDSRACYPQLINEKKILSPAE